jgi:hypothetical protein
MILDPEAGLVLGAETLGRKEGPLDHRRGKGWEFLRRRRIVEGSAGQRKALAHPSQAGALVAGVLDAGSLVLVRLTVVLVGFVVVVQLECVDECRPRSSTRPGRYLSRSMKRRKLCGRRRRNLCGRCEGGLEPSCSSQDGPTPAPAALAVIRSARIYVAAVAPVAPRRRPRQDGGDGDDDDDDDEATASP